MNPSLCVRASATHGKGVFATRALSRGTFLGFYTGRYVPMRTYLAARKPMDDCNFSIQVGRGIRIAEPTRDVLSLVNEPPPHTHANASMVEVVHPNRRDVAIAYYAARRIRAHEEICVHYGPNYYERDYAVGKQAPRIPRCELEDPMVHMSTLPRRAFCRA